MSHRHFCDYAGHEWECSGTALRSLAGGTERSVCMCPIHQVPLADGDHSECPAELLACPAHREEQLQKIGTLSSGDLASDDGTAESSMFNDMNGKPIVGFCLSCNEDFYSMNEFEAHNLNDSAACVVLQNFRNEQSMPPGQL
jgi:hypothetical protein